MTLLMILALQDPGWTYQVVRVIEGDGGFGSRPSSDSITISDDSKLMAVCESPGIRVFNLETWELQYEVKVENANVNDLAFLDRSHDLIGGLSDGSVRIWKETGEEGKSYEGAKKSVTCVAVGAGFVVATTQDNKMWMWDAKSGTKKMEEAVNPSPTGGHLLKFTGDNKHLVIMDREGIWFRTIAGGLKQYKIANPSGIASPKPSGRVVVATSSGEFFEVSQTSKEPKSIFKREEPCRGLAASPDGKWLVTYNDSKGQLEFLDPANCRTKFTAPTQATLRVAFSADGKKLAWANRGLGIWLLDVATKTELARPVCAEQTTRRFLDGGSRPVAWSVSQETLRIYDLTGEKPVKTAAVPDHLVTISEDGTTIATTPDFKTLVLRPLGGDKVTGTDCPRQGGGAYVTAGSIVSKSEGGFLVWSIKENKERWKIEANVMSSAVSADGAHVAYVESPGILKVVEIDTGNPVWQGGKDVRSFAIAPDHMHLVWVDTKNVAHVCDSAGKETGAIEKVEKAVFSADGKYLCFSGGIFGRVFDVATLTQAAEIKNLKFDVFIEGMSKDGTYLFVTIGRTTWLMKRKS